MIDTLIRDTRGLAMIEGVAIAPVLITILIGMVYLKNSYSSALDGGDTARSCAWAYAVTSCKDRKVLPEACQIRTQPTAGAAGLDTYLFDAHSEAEKTAQEFDKAADGTVDGVLNALGGLSNMALTLMGMREEVVVTASYEVEQPPLFGAEKVHVGANYAVMCNEVDWSVWTFLDAAWSNIL